MTDIRTPPNSCVAEQSVIGAVFLDPHAFDKIDGLITEDDFYRNDHRLIFGALTALHMSQQPLDMVTVSDWLEHRGQLENAGGLAYLGNLTVNTPSASTIVSYAHIVRDHARMRRLISVGTQIADSGFDASDVESAIEDAQSAVMALSDSRVPEASSMRTVLREVISEIELRNEHRGQLIGLRTGYADLDRLTGGLRKSDLIILAARPSMGKTALSMNIAQAAIEDDKSILVFSAEMSSKQLTERLVSALSRVDFQSIRDADFVESDWVQISKATATLSKSKLLINDRSSPSISHIRATARKTKRDQGLDLIIVDYLQLLAGKGENRNQEVGAISRGLKGIAKELDVPVVALSQLNRSLESRTDKRPRMSDLRDSGEIEQDADLVMFLYRDEVYNPDSVRKGCAELNIAKHRNGSLGTIGLSTMLHRMRFESLDGPLPELEKPTQNNITGFRGRSKDYAVGD